MFQKASSFTLLRTAPCRVWTATSELSVVITCAGPTAPMVSGGINLWSSMMAGKLPPNSGGAELEAAGCGAGPKGDGPALRIGPESVFVQGRDLGIGAWMLRITRLVSGCSACCLARSAKRTTTRLLGTPERGAVPSATGLVAQATCMASHKTITMANSETKSRRGDAETFDCIRTMLSCLPKGLPYSSDRTTPPTPSNGLAFNRSSLRSLRYGTNAIVPLHLAPICVGRRDGDERTGR